MRNVLLSVCFFFSLPIFALESGESSEVNESSKIDQVVDFVLNDLMVSNREENFDGTDFFRGFHKKANACVYGSLAINPGLPQELQVGLFAQQANYPVWIRFSNGNIEKTEDWKFQTRGMAIKVMEAPGVMLQSELGSNQSQDFLLANQETFFIKNLSEIIDYGVSLFRGGSFNAPLSVINRVVSAPTGVVNPLRSIYWSQTAYKFGDDQPAVKYRVFPCLTNSTRKSDIVSEDGARLALHQGLSEADQCYDFQVQFRDDPESMSVEDPTVAWSSDFVSLATLTLEQQGFNDPAQDAMCDEFSFNPWHSLPEHKPLGVINRVRQFSYKLGSDKRRDEQEEPDSSSLEGMGGFYTMPDVKGEANSWVILMVLTVFLLRRKSFA